MSINKINYVLYYFIISNRNMGRVYEYRMENLVKAFMWVRNRYVGSGGGLYTGSGGGMYTEKMWKLW